MKIFHGLFFSLLVCSAAYSLPENFVYLNKIDPSIQQEMRYAGYHNFMGRPVAGYETPSCILTKQAAKALVAVQRELLKKSLSLKVYDCYRPARAVADFVAWSEDPGQQEMKQEFYPDINKADVFQLGYVAKKSGHSRGSTVDLTIVPVPIPKEADYQRGQKLVACTAAHSLRFHDNSIDMGTGYDCMDELSYPDNVNVNSRVWQHRMFLRQVMMKHGFEPYSKEWWHFTLEKEPYPETYFDFKVK
jgi:D-alanyl-D-alanine dipeptidase